MVALGTVVVGAFGAWEVYLHLAEGEGFVATLHELLVGGTQGALVGGGIGYCDARGPLGESWQVCYTDEKVTELEETLFPVLEQEGELRGELLGKRKDGTSFPRESTLTALAGGPPQP